MSLGALSASVKLAPTLDDTFSSLRRRARICTAEQMSQGGAAAVARLSGEPGTACAVACKRVASVFAQRSMMHRACSSAVHVSLAAGSLDGAGSGYLVGICAPASGGSHSLGGLAVLSWCLHTMPLSACTAQGHLQQPPQLHQTNDAAMHW